MVELCYTETLSEKVSYFISHEWELSDAYMIGDLGRMFNIDIRLARYHLMKSVDHGVLCQVKWEKNTYYLKREWKRPFERFTHLGVKVL